MVLFITTAAATEIQDLVRLKGLEHNELMGIGLVTGLNGTGDTTRNNLRLARYLDQLNRNHGMGGADPMEFLGTDSVAEVFVSVTVPATGGREGDRLDARVTVKGNARSLKGGMLVQTFLRARKDSPPDAFVSGWIDVDPTNPRAGVIRQGCQLLTDFRADPFHPTTRAVTLVIRPEYAGYPVAQTIADNITQQLQVGRTGGEGWAEVASPNEVVVHISEAAWERRAATLRFVLLMEIDPSLIDIPARVVINRRAGVIAVTGDVQISPSVITARGLTITRIIPPPEPTPQNPIFDLERHVAVGTVDERVPTARARLTDLLAALEALKVDFDTRVDILYEMKRMGVLHAQLIEGGG